MNLKALTKSSLPAYSLEQFGLVLRSLLLFQRIILFQFPAGYLDGALGFSSKHYSAHGFGMFTFICWFIWTARNDLIFNQKEWLSEEVITKANMAFDEFLPSLDNQSSTNNTLCCRINEQSIWIGPPAGTIKINTDNSFVGDVGGLGFVCRNSLGDLEVAVSLPSSFSLIRWGEAFVISATLQHV
ncbi:hypothetical protein NE237_028931 [Protea cynaroides]|uniref:RNase H type-1 domain-containing protein n=1 Tax=Protea cynaroides TaxID=273540 RepID=A0A9Q0JTC2_9MAGN|nr:hypothetical protein NE237_028931 [Protea cynaroides]